MVPAVALTAVIETVNFIAKEWPDILEAGKNLKLFGTALYKQLTGNDISDADLEALEAQVDNIHYALQLPLPPEDGTTDN